MKHEDRLFTHKSKTTLSIDTSSVCSWNEGTSNVTSPRLFLQFRCLLIYSLTLYGSSFI